jgi:hypothetical protein
MRAASAALARFRLPLRLPDEVEHERSGRARMRLEQLVPGVEDMGLHPRQRPQFSTRFYAAVRRRDRETVQAGLRDFIMPLIAIRNRKRGYAVSMIKAGMRVIGRDSGPVRAPLTDLTEAETAELAALVARLDQGEFATRALAAA